MTTKTTTTPTRPITYRGFEITPGSAGRGSWSFLHPDYDGAPDAQDWRHGEGDSPDSCRRSIDELLELRDEYGDADVSLNLATNWLHVEFPSKPDADTRATLKAAGFRFRHGVWKAPWSPPREDLARGYAASWEEVDIPVDYEAKADRRRRWADSADRQAEERFDAAREAVAGIPPGQPILVGHHSEARHRADLRRHDQRMRAGVEASKRADHHRYAAGMAASRAQHRTSGRFLLGLRGKEETNLRRHQRRLEEAQERGDFAGADHHQRWLDNIRQRMARLEERIAAADDLPPVARGEDLPERGDLIVYRGTVYPVVRVNKKTVTIANWLDIAHFTWRVEHREIVEIRRQSAEDRKRVLDSYREANRAAKASRGS